MKIDTSTLSSAIESFNDSVLFNEKIEPADRRRLIGFIASRQGLPGSYWNMFGPMPSEFHGVTFFTGDKLTTRAGISHILGEESLRVLYLLDGKDKKSIDAINSAKKGLAQAFKRYFEQGFGKEGYYCCARCSVSYWRNISAEGVKKNKKSLIAGMKILRDHRDGKGRWKRFPFFLTVFALTDIDLPSAKEELKYAEPALIRAANKSSFKNIYDRRRHAIALRALDRLYK